MQWLYLLGLLFAVAGLAIIDWRFKLAVWYDAKRTLYTVSTAVAIFILWDFLGIFLGIFIHGESIYQLPFTLAPEFPLEELFFLCLISYSALIIYTGVSKCRSRI
ncbi:MAG: lycopene cyclase domain-containing protein [Candidatus Saccharimonadaceae bacterium]